MGSTWPGGGESKLKGGGAQTAEAASRAGERANSGQEQVDKSLTPQLSSDSAVKAAEQGKAIGAAAANHTPSFRHSLSSNFMRVPIRRWPS